MVQKSVKQTLIPFRQKKITQHELSNAKGSNSAKKLEGVVGKADIDATEPPTSQRPESRSRLNTEVGNSNIKGKQISKDFEGEINSSCDKICTVEDNSIGLPDEYKTLNILFEKMDCSIRLLALRKKLPTFRNISTQVEKLSKRKFLSSHLAQMKYLLPESIKIERVLIHDEKTLCMIPEIKVILVKDIKNCVDADQSASITFCKVFQSELLKYFKTHVQNIEIPKAMLPEPFNEGNNIVHKFKASEGLSDHVGYKSRSVFGVNAIETPMSDGFEIPKSDGYLTPKSDGVHLSITQLDNVKIAHRNAKKSRKCRTESVEELLFSARMDQKATK